MKKLILSILLTVLSTGISFSASAGEIINFTESKFNQLQKNNKPILIDVKATWCSTCKKQESVIKKYLNENSESDLTVLIVDFDKQKKWVKFFKAPRRSTLISFSGKDKVEMKIAITSEKDIYKMISKIDK